MNEIGTKLYDLTLKEIIKCCKTREQKVMIDYILEKAPATQIYNVTDVLITGIKNATEHFGSEDLIGWIKAKTNIAIDLNKSIGILRVQHSWTPYVDNLFTYAKTNNSMYYVGLIHRLDDEHIIMFFGTVNDEFNFTVFESVTIETNAFEIVANYSHMTESVQKYIEMNNIRDLRQVNFLLDSIHICFTGYFMLLIKLFKDLTDKENKPCRCYIDESNDTRSYYYRSPLNKKVTKVENKPIILILENTKDADIKAKVYRRRNGKIHYAFSWVVRGHYRKLHNPNAMGLDRNGDRCMPGMTWIETYMKGDENLPLLKRERIVIDKRQEV